MIVTLVDATTNQDLAVNSAQVLYAARFTDNSCRVYFRQQHASISAPAARRPSERLFSATRRNWLISHPKERLFRFRYSRRGGHLMSS